MEGPGVEVRRSRRRRRTVSAYREEDGTIVVLLPARMTKAEEREWVTTMVARLEKSEERRRPSDEGLARRAEALSAKYLAGLARPESVRWVHNQHSRWGSCTPADRAIRLSSRLQGMPSWVVDYVLLHELAHLLERGHTPTFWRMVDQFPRAERAKGFLEGVALAATAGLDARDVPHQGSAEVDSGADAGGVVAEAVDGPVGGPGEGAVEGEVDELAQ
jgi:predicted metal-dependent hydrolase